MKSPWLSLLRTLRLPVGCLCLLALSAATAADARLSSQDWVVDQTDAGTRPQGHLGILPDAAPTDAVDQLPPRNDPRWLHPDTPVPNFGFTPTPHWAALSLRAATGQSGTYILELAYPLIDSLRFHVKQPDGTWTITDDGDRLPFSLAQRDYRHPILYLSLTDTASTEVRIRMSATDSLIPSFRVWHEQNFRSHVRFDRYVNGLYYGAMLVILAYNLLLLASSRQIIYVGYVTVIASFILTQLSLDGIGHELIWGDYTEFSKRIRPFALSLGAAGALLMTQRYFSERDIRPGGWKACAILYALATISAVASWIMPFSMAIQFAMITLALCLVPVLVTGITELLRGFEPARYFVAAWSLMFVGGVANLARAFALLPVNFFTQYGAQVGSTLTLLVLSFGVAERLQLSIRQREIAQKETIRAQQEANRQLDGRVQERTAELQASHRQLARRNEVLKGLLEIGSTFDHEQPLNELLPHLMRRLIGVFPELHFALFLNPTAENPSPLPIAPDLPDALVASLQRYHQHLSAIPDDGSDPDGRDEALFSDINAIPVRDRHERLLGHLMIIGGPVSAADTDAIRVFAEQLRMLLQNWQLIDRLNHVANHDALTGVGSRALFERHFHDLKAAFERDPQNDFTVFLADVNGLKHVNDTYGHAAGDALICSMARLLSGVARGTDLVVRLGGDEFALIAHGHYGALQRLHRELIKLQQGNVVTVTTTDGNHETLPLRFSIGCASASERGAHHLMSLADERMYAQKRQRPPA